MSKPWKRVRKKKPKRSEVKALLRKLEAASPVTLGTCFVPACGVKAEVLHECLTCEKLGKNYRVTSCREHSDSGRNEVKKHSLVKHPVNIGRVMLAALKGEEI